MKKIIMSVLLLTVVLIVSGCSAQVSPKAKSSQLPIPEDQEQIRDHYAPVIEEFEISSVGCGAGNNSNLSCIVSYRVRATDDVGIRGVLVERINPFGGDAGVSEFPWPGVKEYNYSGTWGRLTMPGNYSIRYKITDFWDKTAEETKYFSLP